VNHAAGLDSRHARPFDLEVQGGECVVLRGPSGSGKSLLLRAIADLDPAAGEVHLGAEDRDSLPAHEWRRQVAYLAAESAWWYATVGEHFTAPDIPTLAALGFPAGVLGWQVARLSTGEKQRLAIARLLGRQPRALLLDEPTASLDAARATDVERLLRDYIHDHQAPAIWVTHDPGQAARVGDRIVEFNPLAANTVAA